MSFIRYSLDDRFQAPTFHVDDQRYQVLGAWIMADVAYLSAALGCLAVIEDIANGSASWPGTRARPAGRRLSWAGTRARPAGRRLSWAGTRARPAGRRLSADDLSGEGYAVTRTPDGLRFSPELATGEATYTIVEVREALEGYWEFMSTLPENPNIRREYRPDLPPWQAALLYWEEQHGRPHPYGDRLFRPPPTAKPLPEGRAARRAARRR